MVTYEQLIDELIQEIQQRNEAHQAIVISESPKIPQGIKDHSIAVAMENDAFILRLEKLKSDYSRRNMS